MFPSDHPSRLKPEAFLNADHLKNLRSSSPPFFNTFTLHYLLRPLGRVILPIIPQTIGGSVLFFTLAVFGLVISIISSCVLYLNPSTTPLLLLCSFSSLLSSLAFPLTITQSTKIRRTTPVLYLLQSLFQSPLVCSHALAFVVTTLNSQPLFSIIHVLLLGLYQQTITLRKLVAMDDSAYVALGGAPDVLFLNSILLGFLYFSKNSSQVFQSSLHFFYITFFCVFLLHHFVASIKIDRHRKSGTLSAIKRCLTTMFPLLCLYTLLFTFFVLDDDDEPLLFLICVLGFTSYISTKLELHRQSDLPFRVLQPILLIAAFATLSSACDHFLNFHLIFTGKTFMFITCFITFGLVLQFSVAVLKEFAASLHQTVLEYNQGNLHDK
ncbi:hypothetical protein GEMRC1_012462 [Eukaryota sp. GEM-RC1]